jgi:D-arabinose 1-dehydrogenase-like Zn-dependent alcohol dehydrogenase
MFELPRYPDQKINICTDNIRAELKHCLALCVSNRDRLIASAELASVLYKFHRDLKSVNSKAADVLIKKPSLPDANPRYAKLRAKTIFVLNILNQHKKLHIDQIILSLHRLYGISFKRQALQSTLFNLAKKGFIKKIEMNVYELKEGLRRDDGN